MADQFSKVTNGRQPNTKMRFLFTMMVWVLIGPVGMGLTLIKIVEHGTGWATGHDALFFAFLFAAVGARWFDYLNGDPMSGGSQGARPGAARRYTTVVASVAVFGWVAANVIGNHLLVR